MNMPQIESVTGLSRDYNSIFAKLKKGPVFLAQRSKPAAVLLSVEAYEALLARIRQTEQPAPNETRTDSLSPEEQMALEESAYRQMLPELQKTHLAQYIAIYQGELVDHDTDELLLLQRIDQRYPDQVALIKPVSLAPTARR